MNGKCRGDLLGRPTFYGKSGVYLALLTMQYMRPRLIPLYREFHC